MSDALSPPLDWENLYAAEPDMYFFGDEPSQIARAALRWFQEFDGDGKTARALDLGSGEGRDTLFLAKAGMHIVARDLSPTGVDKTRRLLARDAVHTEQVDLTVGDVRDYTYPPAVFDIALAANVFQFLTPAEGPVYIKKLKAVVKLGGICAVGVFSPAMSVWGVQVQERFLATADELMQFFPKTEWMLLDRTEYWTYRPPQKTMLSFSYIVARREAGA